MAATAALAAGLTGLVNPSSYAPLLVGGIILFTVALVFWLRKPVWALYGALFVVFLPTGLIPQNIHSALNRSMTMIALIAWLFDVTIRRRPIVWTNTASLMVGFLSWSCITLFWAQDLRVGLDTLQVYILRFLLFLLVTVNLICSKRDLHGLMSVLVLIGLVLVTAAAWTVLVKGYTPDTRLKVFDMNENEIGIIALISLTGVLWHATQSSGANSAPRVLMGIASLAAVISLVALSGSRGSAISLVIVLFCFCLSKHTRKWGILGLSILILAAISAPLLFTTTLDRFAVTRDDTALGGREDLWEAAWQLISEHPLGGVGIGNAPTALVPLARLTRSVWGLSQVPVHNPVLTIWSETGMPGIVLYLGVLASAVGSFVHQLRRAIQASTLPTVYFALVISLFLGFMASWIKGGGMESDFTYFLMLALLLIPSQLDVSSASEQLLSLVEHNDSAKSGPGGDGTHYQPSILDRLA